EVVVFQNGNGGAEDFLAGYSHVRGDISQDGRLDNNPSASSPFSCAASPPVVTRAPSALADSRCSNTDLYWEWLADGPKTVAGSRGSPCGAAAMVSVTISTTSS